MVLGVLVVREVLVVLVREVLVHEVLVVVTSFGVSLAVQSQQCAQSGRRRHADKIRTKHREANCEN
jgi:hypothetical protein